MFAFVRNRGGVIAAVEPSGGEAGQLHLVHLEYKDDQFPQEEKLLWELEPRARLLPPTAIPEAAGSQPMPGADFDALLRAARWTALNPFLNPSGDGALEEAPIASPFHGALQIEDFQLIPLLKALRMPRVNLLIADDVGLGKTIEAAMILGELLLRRRIQRVLVLTPASLRLQWRDEFREKFSLSFDLVDRGRATPSGGGWGWTPIRGARSTGSLPRITICGSQTCSRSSSRPARCRRARLICPGTC
jgi:hypothetical protein